MKIHIVQKGDTLWNLAEKYGVDFESLKQANAHLSDPDMIMPGMKIKIPTSAVPAKKDSKKGKKPLTGLDVKGKKEMPKKAGEMEKADVMGEMAKMDKPIKEQPKVDLVEEIGVKDKTGALKQLLKETAPHVLKNLLQEVKPDFLESWSVELEMMKQKEKVTTKPAPPKMLPIEEVKPTLPPPPVPKAPITEIKPLPYKPPYEKPMEKPIKTMPVQQMEHPCPPYPPSPHYGYSPAYQMGYPGAVQGMPGMQPSSCQAGYPYMPAVTHPQTGYTQQPMHSTQQPMNQMHQPMHPGMSPSPYVPSLTSPYGGGMPMPHTKDCGCGNKRDSHSSS